MRRAFNLSTAIRIAMSAAMAGLAGGDAAALELSLVSRSDGAAGSGALGGSAPDMDASGEVIVFVSSSSQIDDEKYQLTQTVPPTGLFSGASQIYAYEPNLGRHTLISDEMPPGGIALGGDFDSEAPSISPSGQHVVYMSEALNIVLGGYAMPGAEVFRHDRYTGVTVRVTSLLSTTTAEPDVSNGGAVVYRTGVDQPGLGDSNGIDDVYLKYPAGQLQRVSTPALLAAGPAGPSAAPAISGDGRYVVFDSAAANLTPLDGNGARDVFLRELNGNTLRRLSDAPGPDQAGADSYDADISNDGRFVLFLSEATNLAPGNPGPGPVHLYLVDRQTSVTTCVSAGLAALGWTSAAAPRISPSGEWVLFESRSIGRRGLLRYEVATGVLDEIADYPISPAAAAPLRSAIADDGRRIAFDNDIALPVTGPAVGAHDVYRADLAPGTIAFAATGHAPVEGSASLRVAVARSGGSDGTVSAWVFPGRTASINAAMPNWDFGSYATMGGWMLTWPAGDAADREIVIPLVPDRRDEGDEAFELRLADPTGAAALGTSDTTSVVIVDDD